MINIELKEGEIIKPFTKYGATVLVSNYGRVFTEKGHEYKLQENRRTVCVMVKKNNRCIDFFVARMVYTLFIDENLTKDMKVKYKDKNRWNLRYDNLTLGLQKRPIKSPLTKEKLELLNSPLTLITINQCLLHYFKSKNITVKNGLWTYDDLVQESLILCYKALAENQIQDSASWGSLVYRITEKYMCRIPVDKFYLSYDDDYNYERERKGIKRRKGIRR